MLFVTDQYASLSKKNILVTGAAGFLGQHFCLNLLRQNANVIGWDIQPKSLENLRQQAQELIPNFENSQLTTAVIDIASENSILSGTKKLQLASIQLHGIVNNAAVTTSDRFYDSLTSYSLEEWRRVFQVNVDGIFLCIKHLLPLISSTDKASIVNLGSIYGVLAPDQRIYEGSWREDIRRSINSPLVYSASKGSVSMMTRYLASYIENRAIRVNTLIPGGVTRAQNEEFQRRYGDRVPMGRMARPEEIVGALLFLLSDSSSYYHGQDMVVDGGLSAW